ncbi:putative acyltransferase CST26 [Vanrija pseudolonga]|nr:purtative acyltransferase CST26 [Vanrija pseudolonga]
MTTSARPMYSIPIKNRPEGYGSWVAKIFFPIVFMLGCFGMGTSQWLFMPLLLIPSGIGHKLFNEAIDWTKDGFGRLLIVITVLFAPTSLVITTDESIDDTKLVERDSKGHVTRINLPDRLVLMANHQAHVDWIYLWILACYAGHAEGITILLKWSLRQVPIVGWGMRNFRFIFLKRSWAADKDNLTHSLQRLASEAKSGDSNQASGKKGSKRSPLWLFVFPEGTIPSEDERPKSASYAKKQGVDDFVGLLHPRSTGLLFCLRTLLPSVPDLKLLDVTVTYPEIPFGKYPQDWYSLPSIFFRGVAPPTIRLHLRLYSDLTSPNCAIPSLKAARTADGLASEAETRAFELWLRQRWQEKEARLEQTSKLSPFEAEGGGSKAQVVPIRQL